MSETLLRLDAVRARTGLSRSSIYALMSRDQFPSAIPVTARVRAWVASEVDAWVDAKVAAARGRAG